MMAVLPCPLKKTDMTFSWIDQYRFRQNPRESAFYQNPHALYLRLHERGGPVYWEDYGLWCLTGFKEVDQCLRDKRFARLPPKGFERKPYPPHLSAFAESELFSLLALEPPQHTRLRKLVNRAFVSRRVEQMAAEIEQLAHCCICLLYTSPSPRDGLLSRMPSSA